MLTDLQSFHGICIIEQIGEKIAIGLLGDAYGGILDGIKRQAMGNAYDINCTILRRWINEGEDRTWRRLITALKTANFRALAEEIENKLQGRSCASEYHRSENFCLKSILSVTFLSNKIRVHRRKLIKEKN